MQIYWRQCNRVSIHLSIDVVVEVQNVVSFLSCCGGIRFAFLIFMPCLQNTNK